MTKQIKQFFAYARDRHTVYLKKQAGSGILTKDPILQKYRFTNVFRELDKTTVWYRKNVRERYDGKPEVLLATVLFRMFNRIEVGEAVFNQISLPMSRGRPSMTAFEQYLKYGETAHLKTAIWNYVGKRGPFATGAYIISSPPGMSKLDGILQVVDNFHKGRAVWGLSEDPIDWNDIAEDLLDNNRRPLEGVFGWLKQFDYFGSFHSYEIVTDLRHTKLLKRAPDVMTWCNVGPGARRGINRVMGRNKKARVPLAQMMGEMSTLLGCSTIGEFWPQSDTASCGDGSFDTRTRREMERDWPAWEMRDVEHTLCEFDKYMRVKMGEGRPRGTYRKGNTK